MEKVKTYTCKHCGKNKPREDMASIEGSCKKCVVKRLFEKYKQDCQLNGRAGCF